ncbi:hypothetical protein T08_838 [Trichinella sp. T8]|nr:hypothetical protein T08_838 [Trichinella sp. T8]
MEIGILFYHDGSQYTTVKVRLSNVFDFLAFEYEQIYSPPRSRASEPVVSLLTLLYDKLTRLCKDASHPDDIQELLEEVMAFRDNALEVQMKVEEPLTAEQRDKESTVWDNLNEGIHPKFKTANSSFLYCCV